MRLVVPRQVTASIGDEPRESDLAIDAEPVPDDPSSDEATQGPGVWSRAVLEPQPAGRAGRGRPRARTTRPPTTARTRQSPARRRRGPARQSPARAESGGAEEESAAVEEESDPDDAGVPPDVERADAPGGRR